jgi:acyl-CoA thioester hydrolase
VSEPTASSPFRFHHPVTVRFRDIDVGGHAHHSAALLYFEEARAAYWRKVVGRGGLEDIDYILAEASVRWHRRVLWPQDLSVGVRVSRLARKHFEMEYEVRSGEGERLQSGRTVQVMYDYEAGATTRIPPEVRAPIEALDGPFGRGGRPGEPAEDA